ncbi:DNA primase [Eleftheria terrae]|uniref:DNA primase n=1 Tax=Eleftheria terrae TaxID=1597781 RepID=UPI00263AE529|nr:DNA primase [Eleftheria terrae]WKB52835.1 DNA primase [Eleftheria terrae]
MIPPAFKQDLLARTDIVEIVGRYVQLKKAGINYKGLCPFHGEKTPSFIVSPTRQTYHCFGCGVHGNAIDFVMEQAGLGFIEAIKDLAQQQGIEVPDDDSRSTPEQRAQAAQARERQNTLTDVLGKASEHYRKQLKTNKKAVDYLKRRGLTGEVAARFGLGYAPEGWRGLASVFPRYDDPLLEEAGLVIVQGEAEEAKRYDRFRDRVMFPIRNVKGEVIGFGGRVLDQGEPKYLNSPETPVFIKGRELYGLHEARTALRQKGYALVVEGYMDVVALAQLGFPNAVATLGTACTAEHVQKLFRFTDSVVFSFDGDAAGRKAAGRALEAALPHANDTRSVRFLFLPPEHDPDSYVREFGPQAFEQQVEQAVPLSRQLIEAASQGCRLDTLEGRSQMLAAARPLWNLLPDGALKRQLVGAIAARAEMTAQDVTELWQQATERSRPRHDGAGPDDHTPYPSGEDIDWPEPSSAYDDHGAPSGGRGPSEWQARKGRPRREWQPRGRWEKGRWEPRDPFADDPSMTAPKRPPPTHADHAARLLLEHMQWWNELPPADRDLLMGLPAPHGPLFCWIEQQLMENDPQPWSAVSEALEGQAFATAARRLVDETIPADSADTAQRTELRIALEEVHMAAERAESALLASDPARLAQDPAARARYADVCSRLITRRQTLEQLRKSLSQPAR